MKLSAPAAGTLENSVAPHDYLDLSEFERQVQWSEFVPNPFWNLDAMPYRKSSSSFIVLID
jgi:hypothetical protein